MLSEAGYNTVHIGKWHMGDIKEAWPNHQGFDFAAFPIHQQGQLTVFNDDAAKEGVANIINIHHGNDLNPFINYPFQEQTVKDLAAYIDSVHGAGLMAKIYYTVREITNHMTELWALRSLGDEVFMAGAGNDERTIINPKGADPWLQEHLRTNYVPAWRHAFSSGKYQGHVDAAIVTNGMSRWHNYYIEGLQWLLKNLAIDGIYIDDVAYDRKVMQRVRKVFDRNRPGCLIDVHSWNHFNPTFTVVSRK